MKTLLAAAACFIVLNVRAQQDSTRKATLIIYPRVHSAGFFPFTGALLNKNPVADLNVFYEKKALGFFVFQSLDLKDRHSYANYLQPGVFATVKLHPTFKVRGFFGYIFSQAQGFRDSDSDYYAAASFYWDPSKRISVQNTVLFYDYNINRKIANRILVSYAAAKFKAEVFLWNRFVFAEKRQAVSASVALTFPIIKIGEKASVHLTSAYMWYLTDYKPSFARTDGFIFTIGVPLNVLP